MDRTLHSKTTCVLACGALAHEITAVIELNGLDHIDLTCLPAMLHNAPDKIPGRVEESLADLTTRYDTVFVAYADCGTGGMLDKVLDKYGVQRLDGAHCYAFFEGVDAFMAKGDDDMDAFYLTDFLARQFKSIIAEPLGLIAHPELKEMYFAHYTRVIYQVQKPDEELLRRAQEAADFLGLKLEVRQTGYGDLEPALVALPRPRTKRRNLDQLSPWRCQCARPSRQINATATRMTPRPSALAPRYKVIALAITAEMT